MRSERAHDPINRTTLFSFSVYTFVLGGGMQTLSIVFAAVE